LQEKAPQETFQKRGTVCTCHYVLRAAEKERRSYFSYLVAEKKTPLFGGPVKGSAKVSAKQKTVCNSEVKKGVEGGAEYDLGFWKSREKKKRYPGKGDPPARSLIGAKRRTTEPPGYISKSKKRGSFGQ